MIEVSVPPEFRKARVLDMAGGEMSCVIEYFNECRYRGECRTGISFFGGVGVGKTHAICGLFNSIANIIGAEGYELAPIFGFITEIELVKHLRDFSKPMVTEETSLEKYVLRSCRYLLIDDVGKRQGESSATQMQKYPDILGHVIRERYSRKLLTFITSNFSGETFKSAYGTSIWSLVNGCIEFRLEVNGPDRRFL